MTGAPPLLEARGIVKRFGAVLANDVSHFSVGAGEVLALLGENGAGKSTLAKILYGYYAPDAGEIWVDGKQVEIASPRDARALGIGMVFQNFHADSRAQRVRECGAVSEKSAGRRAARRDSRTHAPLCRAFSASRSIPSCRRASLRSATSRRSKSSSSFWPAPASSSSTSPPRFWRRRRVTVCSRRSRNCAPRDWASS